MKTRMTSDATDRSKIRHKLLESIDPLDSSTHSDGNVVHSVSDIVATDPLVNVHEAVSIGTDMANYYESHVDFTILFLRKCVRWQ